MGDLVDADLQGVDLVGVDLQGRDLRGAKLDLADLSKANLSGANLEGASLRESKLHGAHLIACDLRNSDLTGVEATGAFFGEALLSNTQWFGADLTNASLSGAVVDGSDLRSATLNEARLLGTVLRNSDLSMSSLTDADLTGAKLDGVSLQNADLSRARLNGVSGYETVDWVHAKFEATDFSGALLARRAAMDQNYLHEFRTKDERHELMYRLWRLTSNCGQSFARWGLLTAVVALVFAAFYTKVDIDYGDYETALSPLYFSVVTLTTLGYGDVLPASTGAQVVVLLEVILGYVMLGGLLSIFANRMGRRAD